MTAAEDEDEEKTWRWSTNYKIPGGILVNMEALENIHVPEEAMVEIKKMLDSREHWDKIAEFIKDYNQKHS